MNAQQFTKYLNLIDHPGQLTLTPDEASLYLVYRGHITRFPYQNVDLYRRSEVADLSIEALLEYMSEYGGHCYQQSELLYAALQYIGFNVSRIASWVLMGSEYQSGMPVNHNILMVNIGDRLFLCDPGLASASPRYPLCFNMKTTEEITPCEGDQYKLQVEDEFYNFYWMMKGAYFLLYRFEKDSETKLPRTSDQSVTLQMCQDVYTVPAFIPIRDKYVKVSKQTNDSIISFLYVDEVYNFKIIKKGKPIEDKVLTCSEFFKMIKDYCGVQFREEELKK